MCVRGNEWDVEARQLCLFRVVRPHELLRCPLLVRIHAGLPTARIGVSLRPSPRNSNTVFLSLYAMQVCGAHPDQMTRVAELINNECNVVCGLGV